MILSYRPDIDGLRALAVLSVVFYHAGVSGFSGGFVGVDVFFVISGYLISRIIKAEIENDRFSFVNFWFRRAKRILPILFVVLLVTFILSWLIQMPNDFKHYGRSLLAQSFFASNVFFWLKSGYFNEMAETMPLLHTWTLSVEEQFYLLFPILFVGLMSFGVKARAFVLLIIFALSLFFSEKLLLQHREAVFFLLPTRAFELLTGVLLAEIEGHRFESNNTVLLELISASGLAMILIAVITFDQNTGFPGISAALPCLGAALVIYAGGKGDTLVSRILTVRVAVFIGLISYSLYLWHWPVLVYSRYVSKSAFTPLEITALLCLVVVLSVISYRYIETPFRKSRNKRNILIFSTIGSLIAFCLGFVVNKNQGIPERLPQFVLNAYEQAYTIPERECRNQTLVDGVSVCSKKDVSIPPDIVIWGDSHADMILPVMQELADKHSVNLWIYYCIPVLGVYDTSIDSSPDGSHCIRSNKKFIQILSKSPPKAMLLASFWTLFVEGREQPMEGAGQIDRFYADEKIHSADRSQAREVFNRNFQKTVQELDRIDTRLYIMKQVPIFKYWVPNQLTKYLRYGGDPQLIRRPLAEHRQRSHHVDLAFQDAAKSYQIKFIDPVPILCSDESGYCNGVIGSTALYRDFNHLSYFGSQQLIPLFETIFEHTKDALKCNADEVCVSGVQTGNER